MQDNKKIKALWICQFTNPEVREVIKPKASIIERVTRRILKRSPYPFTDHGQWITNGINEFKLIKDVELHVISHHRGLRKKHEVFEKDGIRYHFFRPTDNSIIIKSIKNKIFKNNNKKHTKHRKYISDTINRIKPDIIHIYGAENPHYSLSALDVDIDKYPLFVSLQTLMCTPDFKDKYPISDFNYNYRAGIEKKILDQARYIGTTPLHYRRYIWDIIDTNKIIFKAYLAVSQDVQLLKVQKQYDFVYFAADISKAADMAIEAFALAYKKHPDITLNIIGSMSEPFTSNLQDRIKELGIENQVHFSGRLPEHKDVLEQIQLSRFALLPLKVDILAGTIREAMYAKIPVISTITPGTPSLNDNRMSILLSEQGDYETMAAQMIQLIEDPGFTEQLKENAFKTVNERWSNRNDMNELVEVYEAIINHHKHGIDIPKKFNTKNTNN